MTHAREALLVAAGSLLAITMMLVVQATEPVNRPSGMSMYPPLLLQAQTGTDAPQTAETQWGTAIRQPEEAAQGFDIAPYVGTYTFCKNTSGLPQPKRIADTGKVAFVFYKSSNEEIFRYLAQFQAIQEASSASSAPTIDPNLWNGQYYYSMAHIAGNPEEAAFNDNTVTIEDGHMYYIAAMPNQEGVRLHFSCTSGLTSSDVTTQCGNGICEAGEQPQCWGNRPANYLDLQARWCPPDCTPVNCGNIQ